MRIEGTNLALASYRDWSKTTAARTSLTAWVDEPRVGAPAARPGPLPGAGGGLPTAGPSLGTVVPGDRVDDRDPVDADPRLAALIALVERLLGTKVRRISIEDLRHVERTGRGPDIPPPGAPASNGRVGWGADIRTERITAEKEMTAFAASGTVTTADGRTIALDLDLVMERQQVSVERTRILAGDARRMKDPLVLDLGGGPARLVDGTATFDLDGDGTAESMPLLREGAAYLARDGNGNGIIETGAELFGPASGNGFAELAALDDDGNGWIDEGDAAFASLLLWRPSQEGPGRAESAAEAGVGAISVVSVATPFAQVGASGAILGATRASGIWLSEAGAVATIQHVDLVA